MWIIMGPRMLTYLLHGAESFLISWPVFAASQEIACIFMEPESSLPYSQVLNMRDTPSGNTPPRRTEWGSSSPPDFFFSRGSISYCEYFRTGVFSRGGVVSTSPNPQAGGPPLVGCPRLLI